MTRNPTTILDQEISVLKRYKELLMQVIKLPQDEPSLIAFLKEFLKDVSSLGRPPLTAQAQKEATQIFAKHLHALDPNGYSPQELMEALEEIGTLAPRVQAIYESYRTELSLMDYPRLLESGLRPDQLSVLACVPCLMSIWAISYLIRRLEGLKHKRKREAETPPQPRQRWKKTAYQWKFDPEKPEITCNGSKPVKLEPKLFDLFKYLHGKKQGATMERIRKDLKIGEVYKHMVANRVSKLISALDKEAKVLGLKEGEIKGIIERKRDGKKLVKVIFHAS